MDVRQIRLKTQRFLKCLDCGLARFLAGDVVPLPQVKFRLGGVGDAEVVGGFGVIGLQLQRHFELGDCAGQVPAPAKREAPIIVASGRAESAAPRR